MHGFHDEAVSSDLYVLLQLHSSRPHHATTTAVYVFVCVNDNSHTRFSPGRFLPGVQLESPPVC